MPETKTNTISSRTSSNILGIRTDKVTLFQAIQIIKNFIQEKKSHRVVTLNSLMLNQASRDQELLGIFQQANLIISDSIGIYWAAKFLGEPLPEIITGIDLLLKLCELAEQKGYRIYLFGAKEKVIKQTVENLRKDFPDIKIVGYHSGYFLSEAENDIVEEISNLHPDILFVGLGSPKQEKWIGQNLERLGTPVAIGVGGSFDIISGKLKRAPRWMRVLGLEWFYRVLQEPWRIKRIIHLPIFIFRVIKFKYSIVFT